VQAHVLQATARLQREFAALEQTLSRLQSQSDAMLQQLQGLLLGQAQYG
jgi:flagellar capping protein FliD